MQRPNLIRNVYVELRNTVGNRQTPRETLKQAVALVELFAEDGDEGPGFDDHSGRLPFANQDLDLAMADGGWRVLSGIGQAGLKLIVTRRRLLDALLAEAGTGRGPGSGGDGVTILLRDIWPITSPKSYKCHFARWNGKHQPLEVWARDKLECQGWQEHIPARDDFNRPYVFSLIQFYHEADVWLFGGVFRILHRHEDRYEVELTDEGSGFLGRLKLRSSYRNRTTRASRVRAARQTKPKPGMKPGIQETKKLRTLIVSKGYQVQSRFNV